MKNNNFLSFETKSFLKESDRNFQRIYFFEKEMVK